MERDHEHYSEKETEQRREAALKRMLATPRQPHSRKLSPLIPAKAGIQKKNLGLSRGRADFAVSLADD